MASGPKMLAPICLVENRSEHLSVNQEAIEILDKISQPVIAVAIVGLYRTGKSYLMNRLAGQNCGFPLGSTVQSETKGIWMWCVPHPNKPNHTLVLLDTEGLGDVEKVPMAAMDFGSGRLYHLECRHPGLPLISTLAAREIISSILKGDPGFTVHHLNGDPKNDSWIFALAVLLSSTFVYNSMGTINHQVLEQLYYVTELTELIRTKSSSDPDGGQDSAEFVSFFPDFVWTVRDFTLQLKLNGRPVTEDEYLENALKLIPGSNPRIQASNLPRECIRHFFPKRKCFVFDRPTFDKGLLLNIETISEDQLDPKFQEQTKVFISYIFMSGKIKTLREGIVVTGNRLGTLVTTYVDAINSGAVPCLDDAVTTLAQRENSMAVQKAADHYSEQMVQRVSLPTDSLQELMDVHTACEKEAIAVFMEHSFKDENQEFQKKLVELIEIKRAEFLLKNEEASDKYCQQELNQLAKALKENLSAGTFLVSGGHTLYLEAKEKIEQDYWQVPRKGVKAGEVFQRFLEAQAAIESSILQADTALTAGEKAIAEERAQKEAAEKEQELLRQKHKEQQQLIEAQERSHRENLEQLRRKLVQEREELLREQEKMMEHKLQAQKALLAEGFKKKSEEMNAEINSLKNKIEAIAKDSSSFLDQTLNAFATVLCAPIILAVEAVRGIASLF